MTIQLNIFTNSTESAPDTKIIQQTYRSFFDTFGRLAVTVYLDVNPNTVQAIEYHRRLKEYFGVIIPTDSLSQGYIHSIWNGKADYLFQLENDWTFNKDFIKHSLDEITKAMLVQSIYHFRFNKRANEIAGWDKRMDAVSNIMLPYCETNNMSNNPHIIDRKYYIDNLMTKILHKEKSYGIEEELNKHNLTSCIYGGLNYPATITHLDGRHQ